MLQVFASRNRTVVAAHTIASNISVIESCRQPCNRRMTVVAIITARNMIYALACRDVAVMT